MIAWIRGKHRIPAPVRQKPGELTVRQLSQKFAVSQSVVYYWAQKGLVTVRKTQPNHQMWITLTAQQEEQLRTWVTDSQRIAKAKTPEARKEIALCAV